LNFQKKRINRI